MITLINGDHRKVNVPPSGPAPTSHKVAKLQRQLASNTSDETATEGSNAAFGQRARNNPAASPVEQLPLATISPPSSCSTDGQFDSLTYSTNDDDWVDPLSAISTSGENGGSAPTFQRNIPTQEVRRQHGEAPLEGRTERKDVIPRHTRGWGSGGAAHSQGTIELRVPVRRDKWRKHLRGGSELIPDAEHVSGTLRCEQAALCCHPVRLSLRLQEICLTLSTALVQNNPGKRKTHPLLLNRTTKAQNSKRETAQKTQHKPKTEREPPPKHCMVKSLPRERLGRRAAFDAEQNPVMLERPLLLHTHFKEYRSKMLSTPEGCSRVSITIYVI